MKKNGFIPIVIILVIAILGVVGYFGYNNISTQTPRNLPTPAPVITVAPSNSPVTCTNQKNTPGFYESDVLNISFSYPSEWGKVCSSNEFYSGASLSSEYIEFEKNSSLFTIVGDVERGGIVGGVNLTLLETTRLKTSDGHEAEIKIYKTTEDGNHNWIEAMVLTKETGAGFSPEVFYIRVVGYRDQDTVLGFKDQFYKLLSSLKFTK